MDALSRGLAACLQLRTLVGITRQKQEQLQPSYCKTPFVELTAVNDETVSTNLCIEAFTRSSHRRYFVDSARHLTRHVTLFVNVPCSTILLHLKNLVDVSNMRSGVALEPRRDIAPLICMQCVARVARTRPFVTYADLQADPKPSSISVLA